MRHHLRAILVTLLACGTACGTDVSAPSGPVTVAFFTPTYPGPGTTTVVARGVAVMDGRDTVRIPEDSLFGLARGSHTLSALLDVAYIPTLMYGTISPAGPLEQVFVPLPASCRVYANDVTSCGRNSIVQWRSHESTYCPANDFGDFCSWFPDAYRLGFSWPIDAADNQYLAHARLLVGAVLGTGAAPTNAGDTLAMALFRHGDYGPRMRLRVLGTDSSRWQGEVVTDMRRLPLASSAGPALDADDRAGDNFGLAVRTTYSMPASMPNVILVRFDVTNVSASDDYRRVHREEPVGGHTLNDVWLAPTFDPSIACGPGGCGTNEPRDDNATLFAADSLIVAWDQEFSVPEFGAGFATAPGLLGVRLVDGPAGTSAKAVFFDAGTTPDFVTPGVEQATYNLLSGGRAGTVIGCTDHAPAALVCSPETRSDIRMAWSIGPIATLAPGQTAHVTIAILMASPASGTFTSGTGVAPRNTSPEAFADTTRPIWSIAAKLRALADSTRGAVVNTAP